MRWFVILAVVMPFAASALAEHRQPWWLVRHDHKEFCAGTTLTWDLREGTLKTARGGCDPDSNGPPTITTTKIKPADLKRLRTLSQRALDQGISIRPCNGVPMHMLSGPLDFSIVQGARKVSSPDCINELGRRLEDAMATSVDRQ